MEFQAGGYRALHWSRFCRMFCWQNGFWERGESLQTWNSGEFFIKSFIFCIGLHDLSIRFCLLMYRFLGWRPESLSHPPLSWRQFPKSHCMQRCRLFSILLYRFISHRPLLQDEWVSFFIVFCEICFFHERDSINFKNWRVMVNIFGILTLFANFLPFFYQKKQMLLISFFQSDLWRSLRESEEGCGMFCPNHHFFRTSFQDIV